MHCVSCIAHFHSDKVSKEIGPNILPKRNEIMGQEGSIMWKTLEYAFLAAKAAQLVVMSVRELVS